MRNVTKTTVPVFHINNFYLKRVKVKTKEKVTSKDRYVKRSCAKSLAIMIMWSSLEF